MQPPARDPGRSNPSYFLLIYDDTMCFGMEDLVYKASYNVLGTLELRIYFCHLSARSSRSLNEYV